MSDHEERNAYVESFLNQYNLITMGGLVALAVVTQSYLPLLVAAGLEMMYLALFPDTELYNAYIRNKYAAIEDEKARAALEERMMLLTPHQRHSYDKTNDLIERTKENMAKQQADSMHDSMSQRLDKLRDRLLFMMELLNSYENYLASVKPGELERDRDDVLRQLQTSSSKLQRSLNERLNILNKRIDRLTSVRENHTVVRTQIKTVEDMMALIFESSMTMQNPQGISQQLDDLLIDVESTEETVLDFDSTDTQLSDFDDELEKAISQAAHHH